MLFSIPRAALLWAISGVGIEIFAYPRWSFFPLAYPVLAFYLSAIYQIKNIKQALLIGAIVTMIAGFGAFHWITYVLSEMGGFPIIFGLLMHMGFNLICLPNFNCFFLIGFLAKDSIERLPLLLRPFAWTSLWVALEFLWRPVKIFPEMVGNTQWSWIEISQVASWGGVGAISFLVMFCGACVFYCLQGKERKKILMLSSLWLVALVGAHLWGAARIRWIDSLPREEIDVAMVQANIGNADKMIAQSGSIEGLNRVVKQYSELTQMAAVRKPALILWPETAFPLVFPTGRDYETNYLSVDLAAKMRSEAARGNYSLLTGGYERLNREDFNSVILIGPDGNVQTSYKKVHLLIFGEYMPFASIWPELKKLNPVLGDFGTGRGAYPIEWQRPGKPTLQLGVNVCYEALIMPFMRELAQNGSQIFVNVTNDSWFGAGNEPYQHLELAAHRTIENGLAMIRSTNTGISLVLDPAGRVRDRGPLFEPRVVWSKAPIYKDPIDTFYRRHGELFSWSLVLLTIVLIAIGYRKKIRNIS